MKRLVLLAGSAVFALACSPMTGNKDAGIDAGGEEVPFEFNVSGKAYMHPLTLGMLADAGLSTSVEGLTVRVEEPLKVALGDPAGVFNTATLPADGTYMGTKLASDLVNLGVGIGIRDDSDAGTRRVVASATVVYDVALQVGKPKADVTGTKAYAVPTMFHDKLTALITPAKILELTHNSVSTLIEAGFIVGQIVDASGNPVSGATLDPAVTTVKDRLFYPSADLSTLGTATASNGLFVYVHTGGMVETFRFGVTGKSEYKSRNAGANKDGCLVLVVYPGTVAP